MSKKILLGLLLLLSFVSAGNPVKKEIHSYTVEGKCLNDCFNLIEYTGRFNRSFVQECIVVCGDSNVEQEKRIGKLERENKVLKETVSSMRENKYLGKPFVCVQKGM